MAEQSGGFVRRTVRKAGAWVYGMAFRPGWWRWIFLAFILIVFVILAALVRGGIDYRRDPSALVPRSAALYAETAELAMVMKHMGSWPIWRERVINTEQWNQIHVSLAELLGSKARGLGTRLPLIWLGNAEKAAFAILAGDPGEPESWAVYLEAENAEQVLAEMRVETGLTLLRIPGAQNQDLYELTGTGEGVLYFGVMSPWLIISSDSKLPVFAMESLRKPALSLASSGLLPSWRRGTSVRGIVNPSYFSARSGSGPFSVFGGWMSTDARWTFASDVGGSSVVDTRFVAGTLQGQVGDSGILWSIVKFILFVLAILCLVILLGTISVMIGLGGWYKFLAVRAGIAPKRAPTPVQPSNAFQEDAGLKPATSLLIPVSSDQKIGEETNVTGTTAELHDSTIRSSMVDGNTEEVTSDLSDSNELSGSSISENQDI